MYRGWESWGQNKDGGRGKFLIRQFVGGGVSVNQRLICWRIFLPKDPVCPLHLDQNPHFPPPQEFCRLHPEPEPESVLCRPYCVLKWFKVCNLKNRIKPKSISVQSSVFLCSWSSTTEQRWRDIMRRPLWLGIFVMQRHIDRRIFFFPLCAKESN